MKKQMKTLVKIKADGVKSKYGYILEEDGGMALIKVSIKEDHNACLIKENCIVLGEMWFDRIINLN